MSDRPSLPEGRGAGLVAALCLAVSAAAPAGAATLPDALDRPSIAVRAPERSALLAAARAGDRIVAVGERGIVLLSDDRGQRWRQAPTPVSVTLTAVRFADDHVGYVVGHGGCVLSTDDGGQTWRKRLDGREIARLYQGAARPRGDERSMAEAERLVRDGPDKPLLDALVVDARTLLVVGAYGLALETRDGGRSWTPFGDRLPNPAGLHLYAIRARGSRIVMAGEQGLVLKSEDGGRSFERLTTPYAGSYFTLELPSPSGIVLAGLRGNVWSSSDHGHRWMQAASPMPVSVTGSAVDAGGRVLLGNQGGIVLRMGDDGLRPMASAATPPLTGLLPLGDGRLLATSLQGAIEVTTGPAIERLAK